MDGSFDYAGMLYATNGFRRFESSRVLCCFGSDGVKDGESSQLAFFLLPALRHLYLPVRTLQSKWTLGQILQRFASPLNLAANRAGRVDDGRCVEHS